MHKKIQPNQHRRKSKKHLISLIKQNKIHCSIILEIFYLPHPAPSLPRNCFFFESYNAFARPEIRAPMLVSSLYIWYHVSKKKQLVMLIRFLFFFGFDKQFTIIIKKRRKVILRTSNKKKRKRKVFYVDVLRSTTYSLSCRKKETGRNILFLFLHVKPEYEKNCVFFLLKGNDSIGWLLFSLEVGRKKKDRCWRMIKKKKKKKKVLYIVILINI